MAQRKQAIVPIDLQPGIAKVHEAGARRHRGLWLEANLQTVGIMWQLGINPSDQKNKLLASAITLRALDLATYQQRHDNYLQLG